MDLRRKVTEVMPQVSKEKVYSSDYPFHYKDYTDNLFCPLGEQALCAYGKGSGNETQPQKKKLKDGRTITTPAKMASIASSSAMTFNLLGDGPAVITSNEHLTAGAYQIQYEKQMYTLNMGSQPANLDAFLSSESEKTAIFCEMKMLEWLNKPNALKESYENRNYYFTQDNGAVNNPLDAYMVFRELIKEIKSVSFVRYDAWQMFKHLLAIYNYTSFTTQKAVNSFRSIPSMAGKYNHITLANVVNEFPPERIQDAYVRAEYITALQEEQMEAECFINIVRNSKIPHLFDNNCNAGIEVKYISAKTFADCLEMTDAKRDYLKRYFT